MRHAQRTQRRLWPWLSVWTVLGLAIRLGSVAGRPHSVAKGDAYYYHNAAVLLVSGHGFISPFAYYLHNAHHAVQTAAFPPLFVWVVSIPPVFGLKSFLAERIWLCVIGAAAVVLAGITGRELGGRRVGLIAAFLMAVYPNIWMSDELGMSEALAPVLILAVLYFTYRFWKQPTLRSAIWLGVIFGIAILGRDELTLLVILVLVPITLLARTLSWKQRFGLLGASVAMIVLITGPWIGYNMSRFKDPVFISTGLGVTLASSDCNTTFFGRTEGYWSAACAEAGTKTSYFNAKADESVQGAEEQRYALDYLRAHKNRLIPVTLAKLGRGFGFFHPLDQIQFDAFIETRPIGWSRLGLGMYYVFLALSIPATVLLRKRKIPSFPLWAVGVDVAASMALTFGNTRYRTTFECCLVLFAAISLEWVWHKFSRSDGGGIVDYSLVGPGDRGEPEIEPPRALSEPTPVPTAAPVR